MQFLMSMRRIKLFGKISFKTQRAISIDKLIMNIPKLTLESASETQQHILETTKKAMGMIPNLVATLAQSTAAGTAYLQFDGALAKGSLPAKYRELISLVVGEFDGCHYCVSAHTLGAKMRGYSLEQAIEARKGHSDDPKEQAMLRFCQRVLETKGKIDTSEIQVLRDHEFSESDIVEIISNVALNIFTNYFNNAAATEIDFTLAPKL